jgi:hypothetical protein
MRNPIHASLRSPLPTPLFLTALGYCALLLGAGTLCANDSAFDWKSDSPQIVAGALGAGDQTFRRTGQNCSALSNTATAVFYDTYVISNPTTEPAILDVRTQPPGGNGSAVCTQGANDTVMAIYSGGFVPGNATQGCVAFNDDAPGLDRCSRISGFTIAPASSVTLVVTALDNGNAFPYDLRFDGSAHSMPIFRDGGGESTQAAVPRALPAGGAITIDGFPVALPSGSRFNGQIDFVTQNINGPFAFLPMTASGILTNAGPATLRMQLWHAGTSSGVVGPGNAVTLNALDIYLRLQTATINGTPLNLGGDCKFGPISWSTSGTWNGTAIATSQPSFLIPPAPAASCNGLGAQLSAVISGTDNSVNLSISP